MTFGILFSYMKDWNLDRFPFLLEIKRLSWGYSRRLFSTSVIYKNEESSCEFKYKFIYIFMYLIMLMN